MPKATPSKPHASSYPRILAGVGTIVGLGLLGAMGFGIHSSMEASVANQQAIHQLTAAVQTLADQGRNSSIDETEFASALDAALEQRESVRQQEIQASYFKKYEGAPEDRSGEHWLYGNPQARFSLIEFADTECSYCKRFHGTPKRLVDDSDGLVNWKFESLAILGPKSVEQAVATECYAEQKGNRGFFVFLNQIFERTGSGGRGAGDMTSLAKELGADPDLYETCLDDNDYVAMLDETRQQAQARGITGTPATLIVDNETGRSQLARGAQPAEAIASAIRAMLAQPQQAKG